MENSKQFAISKRSQTFILRKQGYKVDEVAKVIGQSTTFVKNGPNVVKMVISIAKKASGKHVRVMYTPLNPTFI